MFNKTLNKYIPWVDTENTWYAEWTEYSHKSNTDFKNLGTPIPTYYYCYYNNHLTNKRSSYKRNILEHF